MIVRCVRCTWHRSENIEIVDQRANVAPEDDRLLLLVVVGRHHVRSARVVFVAASDTIGSRAEWKILLQSVSTFDEGIRWFVIDRRQRANMTDEFIEQRWFE